MYCREMRPCPNYATAAPTSTPQGIRNAAVLPIRPVDRRPGTGRPGPRTDSLAGALLPQGLPALGRSPRAPAKTPAVRPALPGTPGTLRQLPCPPQLAGQRPGQRPAKLRRTSTGLSKLRYSWCTRYLSHDRSPKPELPLKSTPRDAPLYAQGYLVERQTLQPQRPALPKDEDLQQFCWDYHQGRLLTWNIAGNDPGLPPGVQLGIKDRRAVTTADPAGRPGPTSSKPA